MAEQNAGEWLWPLAGAGRKQQRFVVKAGGGHPVDSGTVHFSVPTKVGVLGVGPGAVRAAERPQLEEVPAAVLFQSTDEEKHDFVPFWQ